jgi:hypothetical protein
MWQPNRADTSPKTKSHYDKSATQSGVRSYLNTGSRGGISESHTRPFHNRSVDLLWLSDREFVSALDFNIGGYYSMEVYSRNSAGIDSYLELTAYTIDQFNDNERELESPPVHPAMFLAQLLGPIFHEVSEIKISFQKGIDLLPAVSMLPLVPSSTDFMAEGIDIVFVRPFKGLVEAMMTYPCHPKVSLDLHDETESGDVQFLNNTLLGYQHLRHLVVPHSLMLFESSAFSFSCNPTLKSLTLSL